MRSQTILSERVKQQGFTLVEVLVAIAVLGVVVLPLMGMFGMSLRTTHFAKSQVAAAYHAQALMDDFRVADAANRGQIPRTVIDSKYSYERRVATHSTGLTEVTIDIYWVEGKLERSLKVVSLFAP
ncbi:MAG: hypothetical protein FD169_425 [Bacillota bacterium]|nr:MAG: hypothetical protein FD169_425 [Bacillota bacterium]